MSRTFETRRGKTYKDKERYIYDTLGDLTIIGGASGVIPAAASILRDLINIKRGYKFNR